MKTRCGTSSQVTAKKQWALFVLELSLTRHFFTSELVMVLVVVALRTREGGRVHGKYSPPCSYLFEYSQAHWLSRERLRQRTWEKCANSSAGDLLSQQFRGTSQQCVFTKLPEWHVVLITVLEHVSGCGLSQDMIEDDSSLPVTLPGHFSGVHILQCLKKIIQ